VQASRQARAIGRRHGAIPSGRSNDVPSIEPDHPTVRAGRSYIGYFGYSETKVKLDF
jgi:hypothetical protein